MRQAAFGLAGVAVLVAYVLVDTQVRFHLGDSAAYLTTALNSYLPDDRSWTYGLAATALVRVTGSLRAILVVQVAGLAACLAAFAWTTARTVGRGVWTACAIFAVCAANPQNVYWPRAIMADGPALAVCALLFATLLWRRPTPVRIAAVFALAAAVFSLRIVYAPPLLLAAACAIFRAARPGLGGSSNPGVPATLAASLAIGAALGYFTVINTMTTHSAFWTANAGSSRFLVGAWAPVLTDAMAAPYVDANEHPVTLFPGYEERIPATFAQTGIVEAVQRHAGGYQAAEPAYKALLRAAIVERPRALADHLARQWSDYLDLRRIELYHRERRYSGTTNYNQSNRLTDFMVAWLPTLGVEGPIDPALPQGTSPALDYWARGGAFAWVLAVYATLAPAALVVTPRRRCTVAFVFAQVFAFATMVTIVVGSNELVTRYLMPLCLPFTFTLAAWVAPAAPRGKPAM